MATPIWSIWVRSTPNALARLLCANASDALRRDVATSGAEWARRSDGVSGQTAGLKLLFDASGSISPVGGGDEAGVRLQCILGHAGQP